MLQGGVAATLASVALHCTTTMPVGKNLGSNSCVLARRFSLGFCTDCSAKSGHFFGHPHLAGDLRAQLQLQILHLTKDPPTIVKQSRMRVYFSCWDGNRARQIARTGQDLAPQHLPANGKCSHSTLFEIGSQAPVVNPFPT